MAESHCFISYSRSDREIVIPIDEYLRLHGYESWVDESYLKPAQRFPEKILEAVRHAVAVIFVISRESMRSPHCEAELKCALESGVLIIPAEIEPVDSNSPEVTEGARQTLAEYEILKLEGDARADNQAAFEQFLTQLVSTLGGAWEDEEPAARIRSLTARWKKAEPAKKYAYLLSEGDLLAIDEWLRKRRRDEVRFRQDEREFVFQSRRRSEMRQKQLQDALGNAQRAALRSELLELMSRARETHREAPQRAVLMAVHILRLAEAARMPELNAEGLLRELLAGLSGRRIDSGTSGTVGFCTAPDGRRCALLTRSNHFAFVDLHEDEPSPSRLVAIGDLGAVHGSSGTEVMSFSPDGCTLASGGWLDGSLTLWKFAENGVPSDPLRLAGSSAPKSFVIFSPDGKYLVAWASSLVGGHRGDQQYTATLWDLTDTDRPGEELIIGGRIRIASFAPNSAALWFRCESELKHGHSLWDLHGGKPRQARIPDSVAVVGGFMDDGRLAVVDSDQPDTVRLVDAKSDQCVSLPAPDLGPGAQISFIQTAKDTVFFGVRRTPGESFDVLATAPCQEPRLLWTDLRGPVREWWLSPDAAFLLLQFENSAPVIVNTAVNRKWNAGTMEAHEPGSERVLMIENGVMGGGATIQSWLATWSYDSQGDQRTLFSGGEDGQVLRWDLSGSHPPMAAFVHAHHGRVTALAVKDNPPVVASAGAGNAFGRLEAPEIRIRTKGVSRVLRGHDGPIDELLFVAGTGKLLSFAMLESARVWSLESIDLDAVPNHLDTGARISTAAIGSEGNTIILGREDGAVEQMDFSVRKSESHEIVRVAEDIAAVEICDSAAIGAAVGKLPDAPIMLWRLKEADAPRIVAFPSEDSPCALHISESGNWVAAGTLAGEVGVVHVSHLGTTPSCSTVNVGHQSAIAFSVHEQSRLLAIGTGFYFSQNELWASRGGMVYVAELPKVAGPIRLVDSFLAAPGGSVVAVKFAGNGRQLFVGGTDGTIRKWDLEHLSEPVATFAHPAKFDERPTLNIFDVDRTVTWLVAGFDDGSVVHWDLRLPSKDQADRICRPHRRGVTSLKIEELARFAVSGSKDGSVVRLTNDGRSNVTVLHRHGTAVLKVAVSVTDLITSVDESGSICCSPNSIDVLLERAERIVGRNFKRKEWSRFRPDESYQRTFARLPLEPERQAQGAAQDLFGLEAFVDTLDDEQANLPKTLEHPDRTWQLLNFGGISTLFPSDWRIESVSDVQCVLSGSEEGQVIFLAICPENVSQWTFDEAMRLSETILSRSIAPLSEKHVSEEQGHVFGLVQTGGLPSALQMIAAGERDILALARLGENDEAREQTVSVFNDVIEGLCSPGVPIFDLRRLLSTCRRFWINLPHSWFESHLKLGQIDLTVFQPDPSNGYYIGVGRVENGFDAEDALRASLDARDPSDIDMQQDDSADMILYHVNFGGEDVQGVCFLADRKKSTWLIFIELPNKHMQKYAKLIIKFAMEVRAGFLIHKPVDNSIQK